MKILALSDKKDKSLWDFYDKSKVQDYDLIISCGDLPADYLSLLVSYARCPLLFVRGNHDQYKKGEPEGCLDIDGKLIVYKGIKILGLGGSARYKPGKNQYSEREMFHKYLKLYPRILMRGGVDILVTHAAATGLGDIEDSVTHKGFKVFRKIIEKHSPILHLHGHVHLNYGSIPREMQFNETRIINTYQKYKINIDI